MEGIARIGRYTIDLTEQMGRMMLFVLSSFAWLTRPPFRVYQIVKQLNFIGYKSTFVVVLITHSENSVLKRCSALPWRSASSGNWVPFWRR